MRDESAGRQDLRKPTKEFALRIIKLYAALPKTTEGQVLGKQILDQELRLEPITGRRAEQSQTLTL